MMSLIDILHSPYSILHECLQSCFVCFSNTVKWTTFDLVVILMFLTQFVEWRVRSYIEHSGQQNRLKKTSIVLFFNNNMIQAVEK